MEKLKGVGFGVLLVLLLVSVVMLYNAGKELITMRSADSYEDKGVHTFVPTKVLPHQVKNTSASGRNRRRNPTKTVYMVYYRTTDQARYEWKVKAPSRSSGETTVEEGNPVERRVLSIPEEGTYITTESDQDAKSYTSSLRMRYILFVIGSSIYILAFASVSLMHLSRKRSIDK